ncbi:MAG: 23S rRNA (guanosine(2251)-2'-O)-methyltransferase RlmB [Bacilli bacterium]|nr:23S rRNA (guanosine(2251)-2'-O)-methyltransferase RlmB [Bacilli bacterium]
MLVYGRNVARDLFENHKKIRKIIIQENFEDKNLISLIEKSKIMVEVLSKKEMDHLCSGLHQGIILDIPDYQYAELREVLEDEEDSFVVLLDHLEDPHNLGAIIRTCEAAGVKSIILPKDRQVLINGTVMKTSVGTLDNMRIVLVSNLVNAIERLKETGFWIVGTSLEGDKDYREIDYQGKIALVIGNEGAGISQLVARNCDFLAKIPMYGQTNSLNASVAAGIMIYEVIRNRK